MIRRFNYTGRKSIRSSMVEIRLSGESSPEFEVGWQLEKLQLPADAPVFVEVVRSGSPRIQRFPYGTVAAPHPPSDRRLDDADGRSYQFNIKVVDGTRDRRPILALGTGLSPTGPGTGQSALRSLLPVNPRDLGQEIWRLGKIQGKPCLEVNSRIPDIMQMIKVDPVFFGLVYPHVIRKVLLEILVDHAHDDVDTEGDDWRTHWLRWGVQWHPEKERPQASAPDGSIEAQVEWADAVAESFCRRNEVLHRFVEALDARGRR